MLTRKIINEFNRFEWFKSKRFGYGWTPTNMWGWATVTVFLLQFLINLFLIVKINVSVDVGFVIFNSIINMIMAISFLLLITIKTSR